MVKKVMRRRILIFNIKVDVEWSTVEKTVEKAYFDYIEETNNEDDYDDKFKKFKSLVKKLKKII